MALEGIVSNGVIVPDPAGNHLPDGTRVQFVPFTGMEPLIRKTPGVCGGRACIGRRRIPVWGVIEYHRLGQPDEAPMAQYEPPLSREEFDAALKYAASHPQEIAQDIRENDEP